MKNHCALLRTLVLLVLVDSWLAVAVNGDENCLVDDESGLPFVERLTTSDALGPFYVPDSPVSEIIAPRSLLLDPDNVFVVRGKVLGNDCVPLAKAQVEAWYAGEEGYSDTDYRGQTVADDCGNFEFTQLFPAIYPSRPIPHIHYRVSSPDDDGIELLVTQLYFEGAIPSGYNPDEARIAQIVNEDDGSQSAEFHIYVSIPGTADLDTCESIDINEMSTLIPDETMAPSEFATVDGSEMNPELESNGVEGQACGPTVCEFPQECCNESCGVCVDPGGICTMRGCVDPLSEGSSPGVGVSTTRTEGSDLFQ